MLIDIQDSAYKDLKKIDKSEAIKILQTIKKLEDYKLTNHYPPFRLRIGDYRVLFEENKIIVSSTENKPIPSFSNNNLLSLPFYD